ncbi:cadherin-like domain-containing protein [Mangrovibacter yixingensis]|uniref:cadherin-like domain-containing protein n=1 Tax=Mangrovibacter yixingensis TaxID=1529639 RepID=UPI001CF95B03|nr:cadherin-like domain-containing protein [Mangrovibacter yixingensis]
MFDAAAVATAENTLTPENSDATTNQDTTQDSTHQATGDSDDLAQVVANIDTSAEKHQVYFIDASVPDKETLINQIPADAEVYILDANKDGLNQIADILAGKENIDAVHIISHGASGEIELGNSVITADNLADYSAALNIINVALNSSADILLYGCNVGDDNGLNLLQALSASLDADVAASDDTTGVDGDWVLETQVGNGTIDTASLAPTHWLGNLLIGLNTPPVAVADVAVVDEDATTVINVLANDTDLEGNALTVTSASALFGQVTINANGTLNYTPNANFFGVDTITYMIRDSGGLYALAPGTVAVTVNPVNDLPTISLPVINLLQEDTPLIFASALGTQISIGDIDGSIAQVSLSVPVGTLTLSQTANLSFSQGDGVNDSQITIKGNIEDINAALNGLIYTPDADYNGPVTITIGLTDTLLSIPLSFSLPIGIAPVADIVNDTVTAGTGAPVSFNVMANDTFENINAKVTSYSSPAHGTVTIDAAGNAIYTPNSGYLGNDSFTYTVTSNGTTETATVTINVVDLNHAPVAGNDSATTAEDTAITVNVLANDTDADGDTLTITAASASHGTVVINANGTLTYTPAANYNGTDTVTYTISDGHGGTATGTLALTVTAVNDNPVAVNDSATTAEDTPITVNVLANDSDVDGDSLTVTAASAGHGTVVINANGTLTYTPAANYNGTDTVTYTISDGHGGTATGTLALTVTAVNDNPVAANDSATTTEDTPITVNVLANDSDVDGDSLTVTAASAGHGTVVINANGTLTYTPAANYNGTDTVTYTISDGNGGTATGTLALTVTAVNDNPVTVNDSATTAEDTPITVNVLANDSDVDGDSLTVTAASASHGTVVINGDGTLTYTPAANYNGTDTVTYTISDGHGGTATGTLALTVTAVNDNPVAANDSATTAEDTPITVNVLANDSDVDGDTLAVTAASAGHGTVVINANGTLTYTPNANYNGTDTVTYTISDGNGGTATGNLTVSVTAVNDNPVAANDSATTAEDTPVTVNVLANDSDVDGDSLTVSSASAANGTVVINANGTITYTPATNYNGTDTITYTVSDGNGGTATATLSVTVTPVNDAPVAGTVSATTAEDTPVTVNVLSTATDADGDTLAVTAASAGHGTVVINGDGTLTYTPAANYNGSDTITYTLSDGNGGTVTSTVAITVTAVNDAPQAGAVAAQTTAEDTPVTVNLLNSASDPDGDTVTVSSASATNGTVVINGDGTVTYTPAANYNGSDTITYTLSDGNGGTVTSTVSVTVTAVNDAPLAGSVTATTNEDTPVTVNVLGAASDPDGDTLTVTAASAGHGTVVINGDGTLTYTPAANYNGSDTITYTLSDGNGGTATSTVSVTVTAVNDAPLAGAVAAQTTAEDTPVTVNLLNSASDPDGDTVTVSSASADHGTVVINGDGTVTYTPAANYNGSDTITYTLSDGNGGTVTSTVSVTVTAVNDAPLAGSVTATTDEDTPVTVNVLATASDADGDTLAVTAASAGHGTVVINGDGTLTYTPAANYNGSDTITYTLSDGNGGTVTSTVAVTVTAVNDAPLAGTVAAQTTAEDTPVTVNLLNSASDPDGDTVTVSSASAANGTVLINGDGTVTYTPAANYNGSDTITYTLSDGNGGTVTSTVSVTVTAVNDAPLAGNVTATTDEDTPVTVNVLATATDADGDTLAVTAASAGHGTVVINGDGTVTYTPVANYNGSDTINYIISDGKGGTVSATVAITVNAVNDTPLAGNDEATTVENVPVIVNVLENDSDADGDTLTVTAASADHGVVVINPDGTLTYQPGLNFTGADTITYTLSDGHGGTSTATGLVTVYVNSQTATPPVPVPDSAITNEDTPVTVDVLSNDTDTDPGSLVVESAQALHGSVTINADGTLTYTPNANYNGTDTITYLVSNSQGAMATGEVSVVITPVNDAPVAGSVSQVTAEDTPVTLDVLSTASDVEGDSLTVTSASAANGTVIINADGSLTYTPAANYNGSDTITYTISDGNGGTVTGTVAMTVTAVNDAPLASSVPAQTTDEDTPVTVNVLASASDVDGDTLAVTAASAGHGTVVINGDGTVTYTPAANYNGSDTITYTISDGNGGTVTGTVAITVTAVNDAPQAGTVTPQTTAEDTPVTVNVLAGATDPDGDSLAVSTASADHGTVVINGDGTVTYTPAANYNGSDTITYTLSDGNGGTVTSTVAITVTAVNDAPLAGTVTPQTTAEDTPVTVNVLAGATDPDGDTLAVTAASAGHGTVVINGDGTVTYTPAANYNGSDTITYTISDGKGGTVTSTVAITVTAVNDAPLAGTVSPQTTAEDTPVTVNVLSGASDADGDSLAVSTASADHGTVVINGDGTVTYTPAANYNGSDTITYTISDGNGGTVTSTIAITVTAVNDAPLAGTVSPQTTDEDTPVTVNVLAGATDPDGDTLAVTAATAGHGTVTINGDGTVTYTPAANYNGSDTITYTISDGKGGTVTSTVAVTITAVNDAPLAGTVTPQTTAEDTPVTVNVLADATDPDGDSLAVSTASADHGTVVINGDGTVTYTPAANYNGSDTITYTLSDGNGGTVTSTVAVTVTAVNDAPLAGAVAAQTTAEDTPVTVNVLAGASDPDGDTLAVTAASAGHGTVVINGDGTVTYTPAANYNGSDTITYTLSDGKGGTVTGTVAITVTAVNDAPLAGSVTPQTTAEDTPVTVNVLVGATDPDGDSLAVSTASADHGTVVINGDGTVTYTPAANYNGSDTITYTLSDGNGGTVTSTVAVTVTAVNDAPLAGTVTPQTTAEDTPVAVNVLAGASDPDGDTLAVTAASAGHGTVVINGDGTVTYTPAANYNGSDTITYTISDGKGGTVTSTVAITVTAVNDAPLAGSVTPQTTAEDTPVTVNVLSGATDPDGDSLAVSTASADHGTVVINGDGTVTYTPAANYNGSDTITYTLSDGNGGTVTSTVAITVTAVNDAPLAGTVTAQTTAEDTPVTVNVLSGATDPDGDSLTVSSISADHGTVVINGDGTVTYTPAANYNGSDTITYTISDGQGGTVTSTVTITVTAVNDAPLAGTIAPQTTAEDTPVTVNVLAGASDPDGDSLTVSTASANHGTVTINGDGTVTYTPAANYNGSDTITYTLSDGNGGTVTSTIAITVTAVNDAPQAGTVAPQTTPEDTPLTINVLAAASDQDGDTLSVTAATAAHGSVVINPDGTLTYTPNANYNGNDTLTWIVNDGHGGLATGTAAIVVTAVNDAPVAGSGQATTSEGQPVILDLLSYGSDVDGDTLALASVAVSHGSVVLNPDGTITYTPDAGFNGTDTVTWTVSDGQGGTSTGTLALVVTPINHPPVPGNGAAVTQEDTPLTVDVLAGSSDPDGDALVVVAASAAHGVVTINPDGTITYTPNANYNGNDTVTWILGDGQGGSATGNLAITVTPVNDNPVTGNLSGTTAEDTPVTVNVLGAASDVDGDVLSVTTANAGNGTVTINPDGTLTYRPAPNFNGTDTLSWMVSDGKGGFAAGSMVMVVTPVNDQPQTQPDSASTQQNTPVTVNVLANDQDPDGDRVAVTSASAGNGTVSLNANGSLTYTPNTGFSGTDTVSYQVSDGNGGLATGVLTVQVAPLPVSPIGPGTTPPGGNNTDTGNNSDTGNNNTGNASTTTFFVPGDDGFRPPEQGPGISPPDFSLTVRQYDPVLLDAVNAIKGLGGNAQLFGSAPGSQAVAGVQSLGLFSGLDTNSNEVIRQMVSRFDVPEIFSPQPLGGNDALAGFGNPEADNLFASALPEPTATDQIQAIVSREELALRALIRALS